MQRFWRMMKIYEWKPVLTQAPVRHDTLRIGTMVDVVCRDSQGRYKLLELKTGFEQYYDTSSGHKLSGPFEQHSDCPRNQHQLQLAATEHMYKMTHKDQLLAPSVILRFHSSGVEIVPMQQWCRPQLLFQRLGNKLKPIDKTTLV